jgi:hypothetical protein
MSGAKLHLPLYVFTARIGTKFTVIYSMNVWNCTYSAVVCLEWG